MVENLAEELKGNCTSRTLTTRHLNGKDLRAHHIVVAESLQHLLEESLAQLPYTQRPRVKSCSRLRASSVLVLDSASTHCFNAWIFILALPINYASNIVSR